jgi:transposase
MEQITRAADVGKSRGQAVRVGVDLAKRVIQVHAVDATGHVLCSRALPRDKFIAWCAQLPAGCTVAMETSSSSHHWARKLIALGLDARIVAAQLVSPYRKQGASGKNDANDAAAICEAASRPQMHFVPVKSIEQQSMLCVHRLRGGMKADRTACINRIRGLLAEFGLVFAQSPAALEAVLSDTLEDASNEMNTLARLCVQQAQAQWRELDAHIAWCDQRIAAHAKDNADVKKAATLMGIGPVGASAAVATVGDFKQFRHAAQFGAWIGLVPRQHSSGGKNNLGGITKRGDNYLRSLLIQGAKSAVMTAHKRSDPISQWAAALRSSKSALGAYFRRMCSRMDKPKAVTAAAHKLARLIYTMLTKGQEYTDQGQEYYEERYRERVLRALSQRAAKMGMQMVPIAQPA